MHASMRCRGAPGLVMSEPEAYRIGPMGLYP